MLSTNKWLQHVKNLIEVAHLEIDTGGGVKDWESHICANVENAHCDWPNTLLDGVKQLHNLAIQHDG